MASKNIRYIYIYRNILICLNFEHGTYVIIMVISARNIKSFRKLKLNILEL
jgi:hypothetical protein